MQEDESELKPANFIMEEYPGCRTKEYELDTTDLSSVEFGREIKSKEFSLSSEIAFFNHGSYGTLPKRVQDIQMKYMQEREEHPDMWFRINAKIYLDKARQAVADFVGADVQNLLLVNNATTAINDAVKSYPFKSGDAILDTSLTYGSIKNLCADFTSRIRPDIKSITLQLDFPIESEDFVVQKYQDILEQHPEIKFVILDHITSPTSIVMPVKKIVDICHKHGALVLIDGAHTVGHLPLNISVIGADLYTTNLHKWVYSPRGSAVLWFASKHGCWIRPTNTSWQIGLSLDKQFFDQGTRDHIPLICARHALQFYNAIGGIERIISYTTELAERAKEILTTELGLEALQIPPTMEAPNMRLFKLPSFPKFPVFPDNSWNLQRALFGATNVFGIVVSISGAYYVRNSFQIYNNLDDLNTFVKVLKDFIASNA